MGTVFNIVAWAVLAVIAAACALNVFTFLKIKRVIHKLELSVYPKSDRRSEIFPSDTLSDREFLELKDQSRKAARDYALYSNITAIFPLLGILGTVASLMGLGSVDDLSANFASALWTTFVGLICAIFFKALDAGISADLDRLLDESDHIIRERDRKNGGYDASEK